MDSERLEESVQVEDQLVLYLVEEPARLQMCLLEVGLEHQKHSIAAGD